MTRLYSYTTDYFRVVDQPEQAYWLGLLWADGCLFSKSNKCKQVIITLQKDDKYILEQFKKAIGSNHKIRTERKKYSRLEIYGLDMYNDLMNRGFDLRKSKLNIVPDFPKELTSDFIRGVF